MSGRNEYRRDEKAEGKAGEEEIVMCPASEVYISTAPQKQILRQGFKCKLFIKEVLPGETSKGMSETGEGGDGAQQEGDFQGSPSSAWSHGELWSISCISGLIPP